MWALVPLKLLAQAKGRLADQLTGSQRQALVIAMARDVLAALAGCAAVERVMLISRNAEAQTLADEVGAVRFMESADADLPGALVEAIAAAHSAGAGGVCIVPADAPLVTTVELQLMLRQHHRCTIVPDAAHSGTNALVLTPPDALTPIFDGRSFVPHVRAAVAAGLPTRVLRLPRLAIDIDTPADLTLLRRLGPATHAARALAAVTAPP